MKIQYLYILHKFLDANTFRDITMSRNDSLLTPGQRPQFRDFQGKSGTGGNAKPNVYAIQTVNFAKQKSEPKIDKLIADTIVQMFVEIAHI